MYQRLVEHNLKNEGKQRRGRHPMASGTYIIAKGNGVLCVSILFFLRYVYVYIHVFCLFLEIIVL